jgi:translation initiation factor 1 (eIF-1/SUI1)
MYLAKLGLKSYQRKKSQQKVKKDTRFWVSLFLQEIKLNKNNKINVFQEKNNKGKEKTIISPLNFPP